MKYRKKILMFGLITILLMATLIPIATAGEYEKFLVEKPLNQLCIKVVPEVVEEGKNFKVYVTIKPTIISSIKSDNNKIGGVFVQVYDHTDFPILEGDTDKYGIIKFTAPKVSGDKKYTIIARLEGYSPGEKDIIIKDIKTALKEIKVEAKPLFRLSVKADPKEVKEGKSFVVSVTIKSAIIRKKANNGIEKVFVQVYDHTDFPILEGYTGEDGIIKFTAPKVSGDTKYTISARLEGYSPGKTGLIIKDIKTALKEIKAEAEALKPIKLKLGLEVDNKVPENRYFPVFVYEVKDIDKKADKNSAVEKALVLLLIDGKLASYDLTGKSGSTKLFAPKTKGKDIDGLVLAIKKGCQPAMEKIVIMSSDKTTTSFISASG